MTPNLIPTADIKKWLQDKPVPPLGGAVPVGYVWGLSVDLLEARGEVFPYDIECFKEHTKEFQNHQATSKFETTVVWRGSTSDLVTDLMPLLSVAQQVKLGEELISRAKDHPDTSN